MSPIDDERGPSRRRVLADAAAATAGALLGWRSARAAQGAQAPETSARTWGAVGDGRTDDTRAIQRALDAAGPGSRVTVPGGTYRVGTLHLRSHLTLALAPDAVLLASPDDDDFDPVERLPHRTFADRETSDFAHALLAGDGLADVTIEGGTIDGNRGRRGGPKTVALRRCQGVRLAGVRILRAPNYAVSLLGCDDVAIDAVVVEGGHADGIDPDCCTDVRITRCRVDSLDDGICLKSSLALGEPRMTERVLIADCTVRSSSFALKLGSESVGGFRDVTIRRCTLIGRPAPGVSPRIAENGGIGLEIVDGGTLEDVAIAEITMDGIAAPIFVRLGDRRTIDGRRGRLRRVRIERVTAEGASVASSITGLVGAVAEDIVLRELRIAVAAGTVAAPENLDVPERPSAYPWPRMFGRLPAYGLYCRHVRGVRVEEATLTAVGDDRRSAVVLDDVDAVTLDRLTTSPGSGSVPVVWMHDTRRADVRRVAAAPGTGLYLRVTGAESEDIAFARHDVRATTPLEMGAEVTPSTIAERPG